MLRILHVIPGLTEERGGPSYVLQALVQHQCRAGNEVTVLTTDQGEKSGETPTTPHPDARLVKLPVRGPDRIAYAPSISAAARDLMRTTDVVHVHSIFTYPVHVAWRDAAKAGIPLILRPCGHLHPYSLGRSSLRKRLYLALWGRRLRRAVAAWHYTSEQEAHASWPRDASNRFILPNGIEPDEYAVDRAEARRLIARMLPNVGASPYVLFLGRLHPKKRLDLLIDAFLAGAPPEFKLVVAGPDECGLWPRLARARLGSPRESARVVRVPAIGARDKVTLLAGARLFALPSEHENFGVAALEALACGTPVLLSPHVDLAERAGSSGLGFTAPLSVAVWREQLAALLTDHERFEALAHAARAWVAEHFAWSQISTALTERYRWVVHGCPAAAAPESRRQAPQEAASS